MVTVTHSEIVVDETNKKQLRLEGGIVRSHPKGGCGLAGCKCSPGHWISVIEPMREGKITITKFVFNSREELEAFDGVA